MNMPVSKKMIQAIEQYQVPGAMEEFDPKVSETTNTHGWVGWHPGTMMSRVGTICLGLPNGFNRVGPVPTDRFVSMFRLFESWEVAEDQWHYDMWNVPVWKYLDPHGNTFVRGLCPRNNMPFLHIILGDCRDKISCLEITEADAKFMD